MPFKEDNQTNKRQTEEIKDSDKKIIDMAFANGEKLNRDVLNFWLSITVSLKLIEKANTDSEKQAILNELKPIADYEQSYRDTGEDEAKINYIMELSDSEQIKKYNELVDEFNADLARIKRESDIDSLKNYIKRATEIVDEIK